MSKKKHSFWSDGLSIDETRFSVIVIMALVGFGYALFSHYRTGDITDNLLDLIELLVLSILGINVAGYVTDAFRNKRESRNHPDYNDVAREEQDQSM